MSCSAEQASLGPSPAPRLVLLYATCSLNRQYTEPYNPLVSDTPSLAAFGRESVVFDRHNTEAGKSAVAFSSIYTATHADSHGVYLQAMRLRGGVTMLSEAFAEQGYETFFWDNHPLAKKALNFAQGVDHSNIYSLYGQPGSRARDTNFTGDSPEFLAILDRLVSDPEFRALIITNNAVPHSPYSIGRINELRSNHPDEVTGVDEAQASRLGKIFVANYRDFQYDFDRTVASLELTAGDVSDLVTTVELAYRAVVANLDTIFGGIVAAIDDHGLRNQSLIAFTSDHGELLFRENALTKWSHGWELSPEVIQVPLIIRVPDPSTSATRYHGVSRSIDLFPTLVGLAGFEVDEEWGLDGVDLSAAITAGQDPPDLFAFFHTVPPNGRVLNNMHAWPNLQKFYPRSDPGFIWVGLRHRDTVFLHRPDEYGSWHDTAYDLDADPTLRHDFFDPKNPDHAAMAEMLTEYKERLVTHFKGPRKTLPKNEEIEMLRSLGYVK